MNLDVVHIYIFVFFKLDEWLQSYDLKCINMYNLDVGCTLATFLSFPTFSNHFRPMWLKNHPQLQIWQKRDFDWFKMAKFGYFVWFLYLFLQKWGWDWLRIVNFTRFTTFPIFCHQSVSFLEKSQKFSFLGGYICKFFEFSNFFKSFHTNVAQNHPQLQIWPKKWLRLGQNSQIKSFCRIFYDSPHLFSQNEAEIDSELSISPWFTTFPIFCHQSVSFLGKSQKCSFLVGGGVHQQIFWVFQLFQIVSHQCGSKSPTIANLAKNVAWIEPKWPHLVTLQVSPSFSPKWGWNWLLMVNFTWFKTLTETT